MSSSSSSNCSKKNKSARQKPKFHYGLCVQVILCYYKAKRSVVERRSFPMPTDTTIRCRAWASSADIPRRQVPVPSTTAPRRRATASSTDAPRRRATVSAVVVGDESAVSSQGVLVTLVPGPDRRSTPKPYQFRIVYRSSSREIGCVMTWLVLGGRQPYLVTLECTSTGHTRWHCTCTDAVYRGEDRPDYRCKHIRGLTACLPAE